MATDNEVALGLIEDKLAKFRADRDRFIFVYEYELDSESVAWYQANIDALEVAYQVFLTEVMVERILAGAEWSDVMSAGKDTP